MVTTPSVGSSGPQARRFTRVTKRLLVSRLVCDLTMRLRAEDEYPEITHVRAMYGVEYWAEDLDDGTVSQADARLLRRLTVAGQSTTENDGRVDVPIGSAEFVVVPFWDGPGAFEALDDDSADLASVGEALLLHFDELMENIEGFDPGVVIVDQVRVDPVWRGLGLGLVGTGLAIRELGRGASVAVLYPMEPGAKGDDERAASRARLSRYWSRLGFEPWTHDTMVLDLGARLFEKRLTALTRP